MLAMVYFVLCVLKIKRTQNYFWKTFGKNKNRKEIKKKEKDTALTLAWASGRSPAVLSPPPSLRSAQLARSARPRNARDCTRAGLPLPSLSVRLTTGPHQLLPPTARARVHSDRGSRWKPILRRPGLCTVGDLLQVNKAPCPPSWLPLPVYATWSHPSSSRVIVWISPEPSTFPTVVRAPRSPSVRKDALGGLVTPSSTSW